MPDHFRVLSDREPDQEYDDDFAQALAERQDCRALRRTRRNQLVLKGAPRRSGAALEDLMNRQQADGEEQVGRRHARFLAGIGDAEVS